MTPVHETRPSVGARTGCPTDAARSTPRWPDVHAWAGGSNRRATSGSGSRGHDHRPAGGAGATRRSLAGPGPADVDATALALVRETVARTAPSSADPIDMPPCWSSLMVLRVRAGHLWTGARLPAGVWTTTVTWWWCCGVAPSGAGRPLGWRWGSSGGDVGRPACSGEAVAGLEQHLVLLAEREPDQRARRLHVVVEHRDRHPDHPGTAPAARRTNASPSTAPERGRVGHDEVRARTGATPPVPPPRAPRTAGPACAAASAQPGIHRVAEPERQRHGRLERSGRDVGEELLHGARRRDRRGRTRAPIRPSSPVAENVFPDDEIEMVRSHIPGSVATGTCSSAVEGQVLVDLVGDHPRVVLPRQRARRAPARPARTPSRSGCAAC